MKTNIGALSAEIESRLKETRRSIDLVRRTPRNDLDIMEQTRNSLSTWLKSNQLKTRMGEAFSDFNVGVESCKEFCDEKYIDSIRCVRVLSIAICSYLTRISLCSPRHLSPTLLSLTLSTSYPLPFLLPSPPIAFLLSQPLVSLSSSLSITSLISDFTVFDNPTFAGTEAFEKFLQKVVQSWSASCVDYVEKLRDILMSWELGTITLLVPSLLL